MWRKYLPRIFGGNWWQIYNQQVTEFVVSQPSTRNFFTFDRKRSYYTVVVHKNAERMCYNSKSLFILNWPYCIHGLIVSSYPKYVIFTVLIHKLFKINSTRLNFKIIVQLIVLIMYCRISWTPHLCSLMHWHT